MMAMKIYVGNLSYSTYEADLRQMFQAYGEVASVKIITDRDSGNSKGFGFVEMSSDSEAQAAIDGMNGRDIGGRQLRVNVATEKPRRDDNRY
jgi:RNA recognition motif-containing protein